ncbi:MAG: hypothetical protein RLZZ623_1368, partial [Actinomycetota bacterium]
DFAEQPVLQDAYGSSFVYSVGDRLYSYDTDQTWPLTGPPAQRISVFGDGELASAVDAPTAMDPSGELQAVVLPGGEVSVVRVADGTVLYRSIDSDVTVTDVDVNHGWLVVAEILPGDSPSRVTMVELATGRALRFLDVAGAHLG